MTNDKQNLKKYLAGNLRLRRSENSIELLLEGEVLSRCDLESSGRKEADPSRPRETLSCDCCGRSELVDLFCPLCSGPERPVCYQCCSCM